MADDPWAAFNPQPAPTAPPPAAPDGGGDPWAAFNPQPSTPSTAADVGKGLVSGVGMVTQTPSALVGAGDWLARQAIKLQHGITDEELDQKVAEAKAKGQWHDAPRAIADPISQGLGSAYNVAASAIPGVGSDAIGYQPQTGEGEFAQLAGSFVPGALTGEAGALPLAQRLATRAALPAAGAFAGGKVAEGVGADKGTGQVIGGILGGMAPHLPVIKGAGELVAPSVRPELAEAAERQGWQAPVGLATESQPLQFMGRVGQSIPVSGALLEANYRRFFNQMGESASAATREAGAMSTADAGQAAINALQDWNTGITPEVTNAFEGTRGMIDQPASQTPLNATMNTAQNIATKYQGMRQPMPPSVQKVLDAVTDPNGLTFNEITDLRTMIGKLKNNWGQVTAQGMNPAELEQLYGGLTQDAERSAALGGGQPAVDAWRQARQLQQDVAGRRQAIGNVLGLQGQNTPEAVMAKIQTMAGSKSGADIDTLNQIRDMIGPRGWQPIASTIAQGMGFDPTTNQFSVARLLSAYRKNLSDEGRDALFGPAGSSGLRQTYDDLSTWAERAKILDRYGNPSGTGQTSMGGNFISDMVFEPTRTIKSVIGSGGLALLLARPATASSFSRFTRTYQAMTMAQRAGRASATGLRNLYGSAVNLANTAKAAGINIDPNQLVGGLVPAAQPGQGQSQ